MRTKHPRIALLLGMAAALPALTVGELMDEHTRTWEKIIKPLNIQLD